MLTFAACQKTIAIHALYSFAQKIFLKIGCSETDAETAASILAFS